MAYYLLSSAWPLINIESFMSVTGAKQDIWLVKTFSLLIVCVSLTLFVYLFLKEHSLSVIFLSLMVPAVLAAVDIYYSLNGIISKIYLVDALINLAILIAWLFHVKAIVKANGKISSTSGFTQ
jgi:hypothetical protein